ncbi:MAG: GHKL domain-containing protein [Butyrivibrio sp.]|nr:GHKL domain-containing protein [Butyrivibrio sp.]
MTLISYKVKLKRVSDFFIKRDKIIVGVTILIFYGLGMNFYKMKWEGAILKEIYVQMVYFILIFLFIIYEWQKSRLEAEKRKAQLEMNSLYYGAYDKLIMLVRERQHDMKNHINAILSMIYTTDNYEELAEKQKEYCGYVIEQNEKTKLVLTSGNPLVAGFMYSKIQEAESKNIEVEYKIEIGKETLAVPEYELVEMMGILTDNAIEALNNFNVDTEDGNHIKKIYFSIKEMEEYIELIVANTSAYYEEDMTEHFFESGYSSKGKGRGIGLYKLKRLVHERNGNIIVSNEMHSDENYLTFTISIPKEKRQKS